MPSNPLAPTTEKIADGVWRHAGDIRRGMNVYFVAEEDGSGVFAFRRRDEGHDEGDPQGRR